MSSLVEIRNNRIEKLKILRDAGVNPYPSSSRRDFSLNEVIEKYDSLLENKDIHLTGRLMSLREQGALVFFNIYDGTAKFQGLIKKDDIGAETFDFFQKVIDIGDFIEVGGTLFTTKRGEKTLQVTSWKMLSKSLRPLPEKWHGLQDEEEKLRKRYLDILFNEDVKEIIIKREKFWASIRSFLVEKSFMEVETPILESVPGGAEARPFITHHNALDLDIYLRISPELWLKRLMIAGFPKVFEIGRNFRNEGMDAEHLQDYSMMEFYWAYADYNQGMELIKELYRRVAMETFGTMKFKIKDFEIDFEKEWEIYDYVEIIKKMTDVDVTSAKLPEIEKKLRELKVEYDNKKGFNLNRAVDNLWKYCRKQIAGPGFLINVPVMMEPLAKRMEKDTNLVERFQVILAGSEMGKGFSELNDPIDQMDRFMEQAKLLEEGDEEAQMTDGEFVEAMEYGMPPTCGFGLSERLFSFLMNKPAKECQIFPLLRPPKN